MLKTLEEIQAKYGGKDIAFTAENFAEFADKIQREIDKFYLPRPLFDDGEPADFGMEFVSNKGIVERIEHIDLFPEWAEINSYGSTTDWTYREDKPIKRPQEPDTQEKIDADARLYAGNYCAKYNLKADPHSPLQEESPYYVMMWHLLERQRKLDGVE